MATITVYEDINKNARIIIEPEYESYFDIYGEPEGYENKEGYTVSAEEERAEIIDIINRSGIFRYIAQARCTCCNAWKNMDSIGMIIGDLKESGYYEDLRNSTKEVTI